MAASASSQQQQRRAGGSGSTSPANRGARALPITAQAAEAYAALLEAPNEDVSSVMAGCRCPRPLAEASVREAEAAGLADGDVAQRASLVAAARLDARGRDLLAALRSLDSSMSAQLVDMISGGADLGLRSEWDGSSDGSTRNGGVIPAADGGRRRTALMLAVEKRQYHVAQKICEAIATQISGPSAHLDARDAQGLTALCLAAVKGFPELCALLLAYGADATVPTWSGQTAVDLASDEQVRRVLRGTVGSTAPAASGSIGISGSRNGLAHSSSVAALVVRHPLFPTLQNPPGLVTQPRRAVSSGALARAAVASGVSTRQELSPAVGWAPL